MWSVFYFSCFCKSFSWCLGYYYYVTPYTCRLSLYRARVRLFFASKNYVCGEPFEYTSTNDWSQYFRTTRYRILYQGADNFLKPCFARFDSFPFFKICLYNDIGCLLVSHHYYYYFFTCKHFFFWKRYFFLSFFCYVKFILDSCWRFQNAVWFPALSTILPLLCEM